MLQSVVSIRLLKIYFLDACARSAFVTDTLVHDDSSILKVRNSSAKTPAIDWTIPKPPDDIQMAREVTVRSPARVYLPAEYNPSS